jgi:hypothetical protein
MRMVLHCKVCHFLTQQAKIFLAKIVKYLKKLKNIKVEVKEYEANEKRKTNNIIIIWFIKNERQIWHFKCWYTKKLFEKVCNGLWWEGVTPHN